MLVVLVLVVLLVLVLVVLLVLVLVVLVEVDVVVLLDVLVVLVDVVLLVLLLVDVVLVLVLDVVLVVVLLLVDVVDVLVLVVDVLVEVLVVGAVGAKDTSTIDDSLLEAKFAVRVILPAGVTTALVSPNAARPVPDCCRIVPFVMELILPLKVYIDIATQQLSATVVNALASEVCPTDTLLSVAVLSGNPLCKTPVYEEERPRTNPDPPLYETITLLAPVSGLSRPYI